MKNCDLFILAGEVSGDLHGDLILEKLIKDHPSIQVSAVAGPKMRKHGLECVLPMEEFQVMGFIDVFLSLPSLIRKFYRIRKEILKRNPKVVLFIDYPGLNLRLARSLRKKGFQGKLIHYICPSVWAWGKKRIPLMAKNLDHLLSIFPFEKKYFAKTKLAVTYVGNPLMVAAKKKIEEKKILTLFPGSRKKELERNLKLQLKVAKRLTDIDPSLSVAISLSHSQHNPLIQQLLSEFDLQVQIFAQKDKDLWMQKTHLAIATSGTITLELALQHIPTVVTYAIRPIDEFIATRILKISMPFYCLVNIVAEKEVFPELFGHRLTEENLLKETKKILTDAGSRLECIQKCREIREIFGSGNASKEVCKVLQKTLK